MPESIDSVRLWKGDFAIGSGLAPSTVFSLLGEEEESIACSGDLSCGEVQVEVWAREFLIHGNLAFGVDGLSAALGAFGEGAIVPTEFLAPTGLSKGDRRTEAEGAISPVT